MLKNRLAKQIVSLSPSISNQKTNDYLKLASKNMLCVMPGSSVALKLSARNKQKKIITIKNKI